MDLRGAKSNVMSLFGTYRNRNCPRVALVNAWPTVVPRMPRAMLIAASSRSRQAPAVFNGLENLSERVGFESTVQRTFNNMQGQR